MLLRVIILVLFLSSRAFACDNVTENNYSFNTEESIAVESEDVYPEVEVTICDYFGNTYECVPVEVFKKIQEKLHEYR